MEGLFRKAAAKFDGSTAEPQPAETKDNMEAKVAEAAATQGTLGTQLQQCCCVMLSSTSECSNTGYACNATPIVLFCMLSSTSELICHEFRGLEVIARYNLM